MVIPKALSSQEYEYPFKPIPDPGLRYFLNPHRQQALIPAMVFVVIHRFGKRDAPAGPLYRNTVIGYHPIGHLFSVRDFYNFFFITS